MRHLRDWWRFFLIILLIFIILLAANCSEPEQDEDNRFLELLGLLPETAKDDSVFYLTNYELAREYYGISLYTADNQPITPEEFFNIYIDKIKADNLIGSEMLALRSEYTGWKDPDFELLNRKQYIGFDLTDVDAEIHCIRVGVILFIVEYSSPVPELKVAAIGRFSPEATADALKNTSEWPSWVIDNYSSEMYHNIMIYCWGNSNVGYIEDRFSPPILDSYGHAVPLAVSDNHLFVSGSTQNIKSMIDSSLGKTSSLADVPEYALAAKAMYELGAFNAILAYATLSNGSDYFGLRKYPPLHPEYCTQSKLKRFISFGTGFGRDETGVYVALALVHENSETAEDNVSLLEQRIASCSSEYYEKDWSELIYDTQIRTDGRVLLAKLYTNEPTLWRLWLLDRDTLVLHEE